MERVEPFAPVETPPHEPQFLARQSPTSAVVELFRLRCRPRSCRQWIPLVPQHQSDPMV